VLITAPQHNCHCIYMYVGNHKYNRLRVYQIESSSTHISILCHNRLSGYLIYNCDCVCFASCRTYFIRGPILIKYPRAKLYKLVHLGLIPTITTVHRRLSYRNSTINSSASHNSISDYQLKANATEHPYLCMSHFKIHNIPSV
jgi:hypothetical protein